MGNIDWTWALAWAVWTLIVFRMGFGIGKLVRDRGDIVPLAPTLISAAARAEVDSALRNGRKIEAIRILRRHTGAGLAEAKATIDAMPY